jgi:hypothetical protein
MPLHGEDWRHIEEHTGQCWERILKALWSIKMMDDGPHGPRPYLATLSVEAQQGWQQFTEDWAARINDPNFPGYLRGPLLKLKGYACRLALIIHYLRVTSGENQADERAVDGESMRCGVALARYFASHARKVHGYLGRDDRIEGAKATLRWICGRNEKTFQRSDAWRGLRHNSLFHRPEDLIPPLKLLQQCRYIRWLDQPRSTTGPGRHPTPTFESSPLLSSLPGTMCIQYTQLT